MGMARASDRLAIGTPIQVWEFVNVPAVTSKLDPPDRHDACDLLRSCHVTGNIQIHEMAWGSGNERAGVAAGAGRTGPGRGGVGRERECAACSVRHGVRAVVLHQGWFNTRGATEPCVEIE
jgi:hypothetical protein